MVRVRVRARARVLGRVRGRGRVRVHPNLGRDVISGEEDEEHVRARDVLLEQRDVR